MGLIEHEGCVYGPVPSRRYGLSLGLDLMGRKRCSYDCVYCQVGRTRDLTIDRRDCFPLEQVLGEVEELLRAGPQPDVITLAGSGDPSLYASLAQLVAGLKKMSEARVVMLTNGGLFWQDELVQAVRQVDILAPSLDAGDEKTFVRVNRPHPEITFERMVDGLRRAVALHPNEVRLEVMIVPGYNDSAEQIAALVKLVDSLDVDGIDLNTPVRPTPGRSVLAMDSGPLTALAERFGPRAQIIASYAKGQAADKRTTPSDSDSMRVQVVAALDRRPCTIRDLCASLDLERQILENLVQELLASGRIESQARSGETFYFGHRS